MVVGGPTTILDLGGLRVVSDPTFDAPGQHGYLTKTAGPAVADDQLGSVDLVLVSHDNHPDNLDNSGRALALAAPLVLTTGSGARRLGQPAIALDSIQAAAAAAVLGAAIVIPAHYDGWAHFSEGRGELAHAFDEAGQAAQLRLSDHGTWIPLGT
jgi:L-ascorbate metabolism protein UlaG (beta-lactamase superfamily)